MENEVGLFSYAEELAAGANSLFRSVSRDRARLLEYMDANGWFGITPKMRGKKPYISKDEAAGIRAPLELWLSAFKQPNDVKLDALLSYFEPTYPETCRLYREFAFKSGVRGNAGAWELLDCMFSNICKEITACDERETESFVKLLYAGNSLVSARLFSDFLQYSKTSEWDYRFDSREMLEVETGAYPLQDFSVMAYCVFGEEMWMQQGLVEKAVNEPRLADMWLYTAMQFVCALRGTDMARLPAPRLPYEPSVVLNDILNGTFPSHLQASLTDELIFRLDMKGLKPSKTKQYQNVPEIKLFIPESLRVPLGTIIAIALAHQGDVRPGSQFIFPGEYRHLYKQFFGDEFVAAAGRRNISIRRSNKSYLQGIDVVASLNNEPGKPKGYILAALARSHKGGIGKLPEMTDIYLKDANFTGYSPEFIAREMFERGVFSFIPGALLEIYSGEDFKLLPIHIQTLLIQEIGLLPRQIEGVMALAESSLGRARNTVSAIIGSNGMDMRDISVTLQNIASGNAPSRSRECLCLMTAAGCPCPCPRRAGCIGCVYEIHTKSTLRLLMNEFVRLRRSREDMPKSEAWRYTAMLNEAVVPSIIEIIYCAKAFSPEEDILRLLDTVKEVIEDDCVT